MYDRRPGKECNSSDGDSRMLYVYYVAYHHPNLHEQDRHGLDETSVCVKVYRKYLSIVCFVFVNS